MNRTRYIVKLAAIILLGCMLSVAITISSILLGVKLLEMLNEPQKTSAMNEEKTPIAWECLLCGHTESAAEVAARSNDSQPGIYIEGCSECSSEYFCAVLPKNNANTNQIKKL